MNRNRHQVIEYLPDGVQHITYQNTKPNIGEGRRNAWQSLDTKTGKIKVYTQKLVTFYHNLNVQPTLKLV